MTVIVFADITGKESVVAASVIGPSLIGAFGIIRLLTNMEYLVRDMDDKMRATVYGAGTNAIPFSILKLIFAAIFVVIAIVQKITFRVDLTSIILIHPEASSHSETSEFAFLIA
jgi:hypothetical protein